MTFPLSSSAAPILRYFHTLLVPLLVLIRWQPISLKERETRFISSCPQRDITTVPNQALALLNNKSFEEQAALFAQRLVHEAGEKPADIAALAWKYAYGRPIAADERERAVDFLSSHDSTGEPGRSLKQAVDELCLALFNTNEFLYLP